GEQQAPRRPRVGARQARELLLESLEAEVDAQRRLVLAEELAGALDVGQRPRLDDLHRGPSYCRRGRRPASGVRTRGLIGQYGGEGRAAAVRRATPVGCPPRSGRAWR